MKRRRDERRKRRLMIEGEKRMTRKREKGKRKLYDNKSEEKK